MGLNRTRGDPYAPVRVGSAINGIAAHTLDPGNDDYGVSASLGAPETLTTPPAFSRRAGGNFCSVGDRWKVYDLGLNASVQPITINAGVGMTFLGGLTSLALTASGSAVQLTVLDDGATIQVDDLNGTTSPVVPPFPNPFLSQAPWYFDFSNVTGLASDNNSGIDALHPLLTYNGGFIARVGKDGAGPWAVAPTLHVMSPQPSPTLDPISFIPVLLPFAFAPAFALVVGTLAVKVAAGNLLSAVVSKNRTAPANGTLLNATFQGGTAAAAGDFLMNTTGGKVSNSWVRTNLAANQWTLFQPVTPIPPGTFPTVLEFNTWAAGDTIAIMTPPKVYVSALAGPVIVANLTVAQVDVGGGNFTGATFQECNLSGTSVDSAFTKTVTCQNCILPFQASRYQAPSFFVQAGGTAGASGSTCNLGAGSVATLDAYLGSTGGGPTYAHELTIEAAYIDSGGLLLVQGENTLQVADSNVAGSPLMWGPGNVDKGGAAEFLINQGNAVASILNQGGAAGCLTCSGQSTALFLDSIAAPAVFTALRNITAALLDTDGHAGAGFRNGAGGTVACVPSQGGGAIRSGNV